MIYSNKFIEQQANSNGGNEWPGMLFIPDVVGGPFFPRQCFRGCYLGCYFEGDQALSALMAYYGFSRFLLLRERVRERLGALMRYDDE
jgi:hypothetical protein